MEMKKQCGKETRKLQRRSDAARERYGKAFVESRENNSDGSDDWDSDIEASSKASDVQRMDEEDNN